MGWDYDELPGDAGLLQRLLDGDWRHDEVLILQPGQPIAESFDETIIRAERSEK